MSFTAVDANIADYVIRCDERLRDLQPATRAQMRQDIEEIVSEVCTELQGAPEDLVGPPLRFVTELRAAAGLGPPPAVATPSLERTRWGLRERLRSLWEHAATRWVRRLVPELRPAWWVARGLVLAAVLGRVTGAGRRPSWLLGLVPYWPVLGSAVLGVVAIAGAVYWSVETARRARSRRRRTLQLLSSLVAVWFAFVLVGEARDLTSAHAFRPSPAMHYPPDAANPGTAGGTQGSLVEIGSNLTGERIPVLHEQVARNAVDSLLQTSPPAAIFIDAEGSRRYPRTRAGIDAAIVELVENGLLNS